MQAHTRKHQEVGGVRAKRGREPFLHCGGKYLPGQVPDGAGSDTQMLRLVVGGFLLRFSCACENIEMV